MVIDESLIIKYLLIQSTVTGNSTKFFELLMEANAFNVFSLDINNAKNLIVLNGQFNTTL